MPSKNMLPKGKRRQSVKQEYRAHRTLVQEREAAARAAGEPEARVEAELEFIDTADFAYEPPAPGSIVTTGARGSKVAEEQEAEPRYGDPRLLERKQEVALDPVEVEQTGEGVRTLTVPAAAAGLRLDAFLARALPDISRARVQLLIEGGQVRVNGRVEKAKYKLEGGKHIERIEIHGEPHPEPLRAEPEDISLEVVYEDADLAVIDKPAGMTVHAGAGPLEANRGTLVNALLHHFGGELSSTGGALRPGIVHRLDKETSGLIVVAKNDSAHRKLAEMFAERRLRKIYLALVHGAVKSEQGTITLPISRDLKRRNRMTTRRAGTSPVLSLVGPGYPGFGDSGPQEDFEEADDAAGPSEGKAGRGSASGQARHATTHYRVLERLSTPFGPFTLLEVHIETGRTHQIRVHMQALGHPVVGDTLYGAPARLVRTAERAGKASGKAHRAKRQPAKAVEIAGATPALGRNFLHAAELDFAHPRTGRKLALRAPLPVELQQFLAALRSSGSAETPPETSL